MRRHQERLLKAANKRKDVNYSEFEEDYSETPITFDKFSRQGYESSSTVQGEVVYGSKSANKLAQKAKQLQEFAPNKKVEDDDVVVGELCAEEEFKVRKQMALDEGIELDEREY